MKRYTFYVFLLMLFFNGIAFCVDISTYSVVLFDRNDVAKYWVVKQLGERQGKYVFDSKINPLMIAFKTPLEMSQKEYFEIKDITRKYIQNDWIYFCFDDRVKFKDLDFSIINRSISFAIPLSLSINLKPHAGQQIDMSYIQTELPSPIVLSYSQKNAKQIDEEKSIDELLVIPLKYDWNCD